MIPLIPADPHADAKRHWEECSTCTAIGGTFCPEGFDLLNASIARSRWEHDRNYGRKAWDLLHAGWSPEWTDSNADDAMSWYWRRPPRRKGSAGRKYHSTDQAWNAMKKED